MVEVLDPRAPSEFAEYARYLDGDLLGKILTRNFLINRLGYEPSSIFTPIGRYGDARTKYVSNGVVNDPGDGHIEIDGIRITFEIKFARVNIANRSRGQTAKNWAFVNLMHSPGGAKKSYDVLIAIGALTLGLEDENYWSDLDSVFREFRVLGVPARVDAMPHELDYLSLCSFFVIPMNKLSTNYFRVNVSSVERSQYGNYRAWGHDGVRCREVWGDALKAIHGIGPIQ